jgi:IS4 transposase
MLITETSTWDVVMARDSTALRVKDAEDRAALAEREPLERVLRAEVVNAMALASTCEDVEGLAQKIAILEDELVAEHRAREVPEREHRE